MFVGNNWYVFFAIGKRLTVSVHVPGFFQEKLSMLQLQVDTVQSKVLKHQLNLWILVRLTVKENGSKVPLFLGN